MPATVFVLIISTQSLIKHQIVINPVRLTKYLTITIVIFVTITISILIYYRDILNYLYYLPGSPSPISWCIANNLMHSFMSVYWIVSCYRHFWHYSACLLENLTVKGCPRMIVGILRCVKIVSIAQMAMTV